MQGQWRSALPGGRPASCPGPSFVGPGDALCDRRPFFTDEPLAPLPGARQGLRAVQMRNPLESGFPSVSDDSAVAVVIVAVCAAIVIATRPHEDGIVAVVVIEDRHA